MKAFVSGFSSLRSSSRPPAIPPPEKPDTEATKTPPLVPSRAIADAIASANRGLGTRLARAKMADNHKPERLK